LLRAFRVPEDRIRVFPNQTAAWSAAGRLRNFLGTPDAMQLMCAPGAGVPPSRFRPPVYVTIWS
jgi:hypothetical protein